MIISPDDYLWYSEELDARGYSSLQSYLGGVAKKYSISLDTIREVVIMQGIREIFGNLIFWCEKHSK